MSDPTFFAPIFYERFIAKVRKTETCWLWEAAIDPSGYGRFAAGGNRRWMAHRWSYEYHVAPIPDGLQVDHLCHNEDKSCIGGNKCPHRACVRPDHLEAVTGRVNTLRSQSVAARNAVRTLCKRGHEFTPENTYVRISKWGTPLRSCRECMHAYERGRKRAKRSN